MSEINADFENKIIERVTLEEYIKKFDSEIQNIFYDTYGRSLEAMPQNLLQSNLSMNRFLEGLLNLNNVRSQKIILMGLGLSPVQQRPYKKWLRHSVLQGNGFGKSNACLCGDLDPMLGARS